MAAATTQSSSFQPDSDVHITFSDQQKINAFAHHNAKRGDLQEELKAKQERLKDLEDACDELALLEGEVEKIPYQIGEVFISQSMDDTLKSLEDAKTQTQEEMADIEKKMEDIKKVMTKLKAELYGKFGNHINLEDEED